MNAAAKTALVTGASQGLGAAIALRLARDGFDLVGCELHTERLEPTLQAVRALGRQAHAIALDLRDQASIERAFAEAVERCGAVDVLVNNAGTTLRRMAVDVTRSEWDEVLGVMLAGTFFMSQQMGRHLIATGRAGAIVSLASTHGLVGFPERSIYGTAKGGIIQMTRMLAIEWAPHGIRVNAVAPGTVETPSRRAHFEADPTARERMLARIPSGRFGLPEEVAAAVSYLVSPEGAYVTGQTMVLDGGLTAA